LIWYFNLIDFRGQCLSTNGSKFVTFGNCRFICAIS